MSSVTDLRSIVGASLAAIWIIWFEYLISTNLAIVQFSPWRPGLSIIMVSVIATKIRNRREQKGKEERLNSTALHTVGQARTKKGKQSKRSYLHFAIDRDSLSDKNKWWFSIQSFVRYAELCGLFDKADTSGDGRVSLAEYTVMCAQHLVTLRHQTLCFIF